MTEAENNSAPALSAHKVAVTSNGRQQPKMWTAENPVRHKCGRLGHSPPHVKLGLQTATKREFRPAETQTERQFASANCNGPTFGGSAVSERGLEPPRDNVSLGPQPGTVHPNQSHPVPIRPAYGAISTVSAGVHPIQSRPVPACWVAIGLQSSGGECVRPTETCEESKGSLRRLTALACGSARIRPRQGPRRLQRRLRRWGDSHHLQSNLSHVGLRRDWGR